MYCDGQIKYLIETEQYSVGFKQKSALLLDIFRKQFPLHQKNRFIKNFFKKQHSNAGNWQTLADIPLLPVQMFKYFDLSTCPKKEIVRIIKSSGTTIGSSSMVPLNKRTVRNQAQALAATLSNYVGKKRKIFLVIDHPGINTQSQEVSARTAGVRGLSIYARKIFFLLKEEDGSLTLNEPVMMDILNKYKGEDVYFFGFTYIIWSIFYKQMINKNIRFRFKTTQLFHSGGWKKLEEEKVEKNFFSRKISETLAMDQDGIHDFYGMAEQGGVIFIDCKKGNKHVPNFAAVIIRDFQTLKPCVKNKPGFIEVMSVLPTSYYAQALLTEDVGSLAGVDNCPCGRLGEYFKFISRVPQAEIRGCGDTFREENEAV